MPTAIDAAADKIEQSMASNNAVRVVLVLQLEVVLVLMLSRRSWTTGELSMS
jgi:hypothetical protein